MQNEIWKKIKDYDNYEVSNMGNVRNIETNYTLKFISDDGYNRVGLIKNSKSKLTGVHRIVAEAFLINDDPIYKIQVNHLDGNKLNNNVKNLEFCTPTRNTKHAIDNGLIKPHTKRIGQYDKQGNFIKEFKSITEAQLETGFKSISQALNGIQKTGGGFIWKFLDDKDQKVIIPNEEINAMHIIKDYPGYRISRDGKVYSDISKRYLTQFESGTGYMRVYVGGEENSTKVFVHKLVAEAFISNPKNKLHVRHKNHNNLDNCVENLEWCTRSESNINSQNKFKNS